MNQPFTHRCHAPCRELLRYVDQLAVKCRPVDDYVNTNKAADLACVSQGLEDFKIRIDESQQVRQAASSS